MTFVNPITSLGSQVTSAGADVTVQGARPAFDYRRVANFKLEETAGDVCRNQIRTLSASNPTMTGAGGTAEDGTAPDDWAQLSPGTGAAAATCTSEATGSSAILSVLNGDGNVARNVLESADDIVSGKPYVVHLRWRLLEPVVGTPLLRYSAGVTPVNVGYLHNYDVGVWYETTEIFVADGTDVRVVDLYTDVLGEYAKIELSHAYWYLENAGTPTEDMSGLTAPGISGRGANLDGTDYISAPWSGGFSYPTSLACAFKLDTLTDATTRTLLSLADASDSSVYYMVAARADGANIEVSRRNPTAIQTLTAATLTTNWHTAVLVLHDETSFSLYFDGTLLTTQTGLTSVSASANVDTLLIGLLRLSSPTQYADGITFDEVSAWTRELSAAEAAEWHQYTIFPLAARHSAEPLGLETSLSL